MTVDLTRWREISRKRLTAQMTIDYLAGNTPSSGERSFDIAIVTQIKKNPLRAIQTTYERIPYEQQSPVV